MKDEFERKFNNQPLIFEPQKYNMNKNTNGDMPDGN
jgi:hypothetical protein